jgi:replication factor A1
VALKGVKIGDFNGRTLSCFNSTLICHDPPETQRTVELRVWFDNEGKTMDLPDLSKGAEMGNRQTAFKTFSQIIAEGLGLGDKPDYVNVKAMSTVIKKDTAVYMVNRNVENEDKFLFDL